MNNCKHFFQVRGALLVRALPLIVLVALLAASGASGPAVQAARIGQAPAAEHLIYMPSISWAPAPFWMGPDGGSVVCLKAAPSNPDVVYAGTLSSGVYRSNNRGATWNRANAGLGTMFIDSVEVDPTNSNIVYAGTHGTGVYKSTNGGASWFPVNTGIADRSVVYSVVVNPGNTNLVYAGTRIEGTTYHGIMYKSTNGGASWSKVLDFSDDWVYSIAVNPSEPDIVLAAVHTGGPVYSREYGSKYTWNDATVPYFSDTALTSRWLKGRAVAFDPRGWMNRAYYTAWHDGMISYSSNNGKNWSMASGELGSSHIYPNGISVKPNDPSQVYLAAHSSNVAGVLRSGDSGETFSASGLRGKTIYSVAALGGSGSTVLAGTYLDGLYRSDNGGGSWYYSMSGIVESNVTGMVFPGGSSVYGSTKTGGGVFRSQDGGQTWTVFNSGLGDTLINGLVLHPTQRNILFALTERAGLRRIDLNSGGWYAAQASALEDAEPVIESDGLFAAPVPPDDALAIDGEQAVAPEAEAAELTADGAGVSAPVLSMTFAPSDSSRAYLGTNGSGVYISFDSGVNWSRTGGMLSGAVRSLAVHPTNSSIIYAATNQAGVLKVSDDMGSSWTSVSLPDASLNVYAVATLPRYPGTAFVGTSSGIYRYSGGTFTYLALSGSTVQVLGYNPAVPDLLFAGTANGVFRSTADQMAWVPLPADLQYVSVSSLNFNPTEPQYVYVGTGGKGTLRVYIP